MQLKRKGLRLKINAAIVVTAVGIAIISGASLYPFENRRYNAHLAKVRLLLETVARQKNEDLANELFANQQRALTETLNDFLKVQFVAAATIYKTDGSVYMSTHDEFKAPLVAAEQMDLGEQDASFKMQRINNRSMAVYLNQIKVIGRKIGYVKIYYDLADLKRNTILSVTISLTLLLTTLFLMAVLLNILLTRLVLKPVFLLHNTIDMLQNGQLGKTVHLDAKDEIGEMAQAFNQMSVQLHQGRHDLVQAEEKYRSIFENAIEGIFQTNTTNRQFVTVNPSMARILGYGSEAELMHSITDIAQQLFVEPADYSRFEKLLKRKTQILGFETRLRKKDSSIFWAAIAARSVYNDYGKLQHYAGSIVDISARRAKAQAEKERQAAEAASKAKSLFLANMSHEIRTPMNAIIGFTDLLDNGSHKPQHKRYLEAIKSSSKNLLTLINDILDLSKIEAGKLEILSEPISLASLFEEIEKIFSARIEQKGIAFRSIVQNDVPDVLMLDEARMRQVLFNLIANAVKFTEKGSVCLYARVTARPDPRHVDLEIEVADTGIGIERSAQRYIFGAFHQQSGQSLSRYGGTGLGLTISRNLVNNMGGRINLTSAPGKGSQFKISLYRVAIGEFLKHPSPADESFDDASRLQAATVLIADDIAITRSLIKEIFEDTRLTLLEAEDGRQAVNVARSEIPDVILLDLKMPHLNGYEALEKIRLNNATQNIPVIAMTAAGMKEDIDRIQASGFDTFLIKPFDRKDLVKTLRQFIPFVDERGTQLKSDETAGLDASLNDVVLPDDKTERKKLLAIINGTLDEQWKEVCRRQCIPDTEAFAQRLTTLGENYAIEPLTTLGSNLVALVNEMDIENMAQALDDYPGLIQKIRTKLEENVYE